MMKFKKMNTLKRNAMVILLQLMALYGIAQNNGIIKDDSLNPGYIVSVEIDKNEFSINGNIYVKFTIDFKEDSLQYAQYDEFKKTIGPNISVSSSGVGSEMTQTKSISYVLKPKNIGEYIIASPTFFIHGEKVKDSVKITVSNTPLNEEEENEAMFRIFMESGVKPEGTYRYIVGYDFGYVEIYENRKWEFYKKLTREELKLIRKTL